MSVNENGLSQRKDGYWEYRFAIVVNGKTVWKRKSTDEQGNKLPTKTAAANARAAAIAAAKQEQKRKEIPRITVAELYKEYSEKGRSGKAYRTIQKQDSLWKNHLKDKFGKYYLDELSVGMINDYLSDLYYIYGYSYSYTESFLKMFYLIFGQAYSRDYLDVDIYNKLCVNKSSKIRMPKRNTSEDDDIVFFSTDELRKLDEFFCGTNAETAYLLGRYCGLRINEAFGIKWDHVDLTAGTILIDRQMQYVDGLIKLLPPKTSNARRTVYLNEKLKVFLQRKYSASQNLSETAAAIRQQRTKMIIDLDGSTIPSTDMVNCLLTGEIQTVNSFKYYSKMVRDKLGFHFKYHYLRHTFGTLMAEQNIPQHILTKVMGHASIRVTEQYYLAISDKGIDALKESINRL